MMFRIVEHTLLKDGADFEVTTSINELLGSVELDCKIPQGRKVVFELLTNTEKNLFNKRFFASGDRVEIPLQSHNSDSFTLEVSDDNGNAITRYRIMRCYC